MGGEAWEEVWEEETLLRRPRRPGGGGDNDADDDNVRWEEQDTPYVDTDALFCDRRRAEGGEGDVDDGGGDDGLAGFEGPGGFEGRGEGIATQAVVLLVRRHPA